jgi:nitrogen-specific signal transduction histidine kinase
LPLSRDIIHRHGGVLEIRERDHRPVFVIELPVPSAAPNAASPPSKGQAETSAAEVR